MPRYHSTQNEVSYWACSKKRCCLFHLPTWATHLQSSTCPSFRKRHSFVFSRPRLNQCQQTPSLQNLQRTPLIKVMTSRKAMYVKEKYFKDANVSCSSQNKRGNMGLFGVAVSFYFLVRWSHMRPNIVCLVCMYSEAEFREEHIAQNAQIDLSSGLSQLAASFTRQCLTFSTTWTYSQLFPSIEKSNLFLLTTIVRRITQAL